MIKNTEIQEKESVLNIINKYIDNKKDIPYKVIKKIKKNDKQKHFIYDFVKQLKLF